MITQKYTIKGMTCAACSSAVERVTRKIDGVTESNVNLTTGLMTITYDESKVTEELIIKKVDRAGFGAELYIEEHKEDHQADDVQKTKRRLICNMILAIPLLYICLGHMLPIKLPLPAFMDMHKTPMNFALVQLILTTIILIRKTSRTLVTSVMS